MTKNRRTSASVCNAAFALWADVVFVSLSSRVGADLPHCFRAGMMSVGLAG
jgi:hypothetical protein